MVSMCSQLGATVNKIELLLKLRNSKYLKQDYLKIKDFLGYLISNELLELNFVLINDILNNFYEKLTQEIYI
jgi:hypothetical protein